MNSFMAKVKWWYTDTDYIWTLIVLFSVEHYDTIKQYYYKLINEAIPR